MTGQGGGHLWHPQNSSNMEALVLHTSRLGCLYCLSVYYFYCFDFCFCRILLSLYSEQFHSSGGGKQFGGYLEVILVMNFQALKVLVPSFSQFSGAGDGTRGLAKYGLHTYPPLVPHFQPGSFLFCVAIKRHKRKTFPAPSHPVNDHKRTTPTPTKIDPRPVLFLTKHVKIWTDSKSIHFLLTRAWFAREQLLSTAVEPSPDCGGGGNSDPQGTAHLQGQIACTQWEGKPSDLKANPKVWRLQETVF